MGYKNNMQNFIITGTDTGIGKTTVSAMLTLALGANYWKPIQSGIEGMVDTRLVQKLTALPDDRFLPESYVLTEPLSPHRAAELDRVEIDMARLVPPASERPLVIEGAGGLMVPITRHHLQINLFKRWDIPVILCARTGLGTINHTLLSLEALWNRRIKIHGLIFVGDENRDNVKTIAEYSDVKVLGRLPLLVDLNEAALRQAFAENFKAEDFGL